MVDRVGSDNPSVSSVRATLVRRGGTRRPAVSVPAEGTAAAVPDGPVRLSLDGQWRHAPVGRREDGWTLLGAYDNVRLARERAGTNRLAAWVDDRDRSIGRSVIIDVVEAGTAYGLRTPGEAAVYEDRGGPPEGLRRIAEDTES